MIHEFRSLKHLTLSYEKKIPQCYGDRAVRFEGRPVRFWPCAFLRCGAFTRL